MQDSYKALRKKKSDSIVFVNLNRHLHIIVAKEKLQWKPCYTQNGITVKMQHKE